MRVLWPVFLFCALFWNFSITGALANDAFVFPKGVFRFTLNTSLVNMDKKYDGSREKVKLGKALDDGVTQAGITTDPKVFPEVDIFREDFAVEYGLTDKVSLLFQLPIYFSVSKEMNPDANMTAGLNTINAANTKGSIPYYLNNQAKDGESAALLGDILLGAKWQIFNTGGKPLAKKPFSYRGALAMGLALPTGTLADPETSNIGTTKSGADTFILGLRSYWDFQVTSYFYINFYTEHEYRFEGDYKTVNATSVSTYAVREIKYKPGMYHYLELDFTLTPELWSSDFISLSGLQLIGEFTGEGEYSDPGIGLDVPTVKTEAASRILHVKPYLGCTFKGGPFPMSLQVGYSIPVGGKNATATNIVELKYKAYFKFW
ncbi:MAG: hypothetical protein ISR65_01665 [Bacteriovoracaceae bacterium]|nr:hypothetical protein [Bacteriovoracaceae bacterium]